MTIAPETYGQRLKAARQARKLPLRAACLQAGISLAYFSDLERDRAVPSIAVAARLATAFGVLPAIGTDYIAAFEDGEISGFLAGYQVAWAVCTRLMARELPHWDIPAPTVALARWQQVRQEADAPATRPARGEGEGA